MPARAEASRSPRPTEAPCKPQGRSLGAALSRLADGHRSKHFGVDPPREEIVVVGRLDHDAHPVTGLKARLAAQIDIAVDLRRIPMGAGDGASFVDIVDPTPHGTAALGS